MLSGTGWILKALVLIRSNLCSTVRLLQGKAVFLGFNWGAPKSRLRTAPECNEFLAAHLPLVGIVSLDCDLDDRTDEEGNSLLK